MATIKDVAMDAGVSVGTVSNVINGGKVSEERRQRVERSIQKLGYQVNGIARKMRTQRTDYVVVILPNIINPFYSLLLQGLEHALSAYDKQPLLCISDGEKEKEIKYIEMARANKVDGIIGVTFSDVEDIWMIRWHLCRLSAVFQKISRVYPEIIIWADVWQQRIWFGEVRRICCLCRPLCQWTMRCESADLALKGIVKKTRFHMQALRFPRSRYRPCTHPFLHAA